MTYITMGIKKLVGAGTLWGTIAFTAGLYKGCDTGYSNGWQDRGEYVQRMLIENGYDKPSIDELTDDQSTGSIDDFFSSRLDE